MAKAIKFNNDNYLDSSSIIHNKRKLNDILNYKIGYINIRYLPATTGNTSEVILGSGSIAEAGVYMFWASIPVNYYGQDGRNLYLRLRINEIERWYNLGVCNIYTYTLSSMLFSINEIPSNSDIKITIQDSVGKTYSCSAFNLYYLKLS